MQFILRAEENVVTISWSVLMFWLAIKST